MLSQLPNQLTLQSLDEPWQTTLRESCLLKPFSAIRKALPAASAVGTNLQRASFAVAIALFAALAAPQFANDKEGLAIIAVGGFALWLLGYLLGGEERRTPTAIDALVLLYLGANIISTAASHYLQPSVRGLSKVAVYVISYFYFTSILNDRPKRKLIILSVMTITAFGVCIYGFDQYRRHVEPLATWEDPTVESKGTRIFSTLGNPNLLAGYLLPLVALVTSFSISAFSAKKWLPGIFIAVAAAAITVATVLTGSRGGYLALFAIAGALIAIGTSFIWQTKPKWRIPLLIGLVVLCAGGVAALHFVPGFEQRITSITAGSEHSSNAFRMNVWRSSWKMFKDNWWFGIGPGNQTFRLAYGLYMTSGFDALGTYCVPLEVGVEGGLIGLASFFMIVLAALSRGHVAFWSQSGWQRWLAAGAAAALVGMMVHGLVDTVFYRPQVHFIFWLVIALLSCATEKKSVDS